MDKLLNEMIIDAAINGDVINKNKCDCDTIHLLTKRFNPTKIL